MSLSATKHPLVITLLVAGAFFMENLDGTVIATALPQMARSFGRSPVDLNVGLTAYLLTLAVFIPISGWVADRFGTRTVFGWAIAVFTLASALCGLSNGLPEFVGARILQGVAGALMVPVGRLAVLRSTEKSELMRAIAYLTWPGLAAPILGPPVGGFITTYLSWRWIFFLNVPLGILGVFLTAILIPNARPEEKKAFDWIGFILIGAACAGLMHGLEVLGQQGSGVWWTAGLPLTGSLVCGAVAVWHAHRTPHPLLDFRALQVPTFRVTVQGGSLSRMAISTVPFLLPLMFQVGFHLDAFQSGLLVLAVFAGNLGMKPATSGVLRRFGFRTTLIGNGVLAAVSLFACGTLFPNTPRPVILVVLFAGGLFRSMQFTALNTLNFADVPPLLMTGANTLASMLGQMAMGMGVAFGAIALRLAPFLRGNHGGVLTDFHIAFGCAGLAALAATIDCFGLKPDAGAEVSGHAHRPSEGAAATRAAKESGREDTG
ncbi:MAG TPA: MFS transporter [Chthoniobacterales bacterium]